MELNLFFPNVEEMRAQMTRMGFQELRTPEEVDAALGNLKGTALVFVNSVCGCAGGIARPGVALALQQSPVRPDHLYTVFAGQDKEATARAREYFEGQPPSSPSAALLKDGKLVWMLHRHQIEGRDAAAVAAEFVAAFQAHCG